MVSVFSEDGLWAQPSIRREQNSASLPERRLSGRVTRVSDIHHIRATVPCWMLLAGESHCPACRNGGETSGPPGIGGCQKLTFRAACRMRGGAALTTLPNVSLPMVPSTA
jgi:hypothetical protein